MRGETILMTGCEPWDHWRQTHNIANLWAEENQVLFLDPPWDWEHLRHQGVGRMACLRRFRRQDPRWIKENLAVLQPPPMLPKAVSLLSRLCGPQITRLSIRLSKILEARLLRSHLRALGLSPTVLSLWHPFDLLLAGRMGEKVACWHLFDEVSRFPGNATQVDIVEEMEREGIRRVDLVFAISNALYQKRRHLHPDVHFIPNAGDFHLFNKALSDHLVEPDDLKDLPHPRIGVIASFNFATDCELLTHVADSHPDWSLILVGLVRESGRESVEALATRRNVHILGYKPQPELPAYLKGFDVGLMPYLVANSVLECYPLKMHEYLAAGLPVVSTPAPAVLPFSDVVSIGEDPRRFVTLIEEELANDSPQRVGARVTVARENSWEKRVAEMSALIDQRLLCHKQGLA